MIRQKNESNVKVPLGALNDERNTEKIPAQFVEGQLNS